ncbi:hypothetical protein PLICRDRAFT_37173 [Plicaturopsis crispa FD-325 SS-3]|nr:hypothetical protein PLICRDRAFT_37173 [Plicaturopsis crispa FD-325 SS-3]
MINERGRFSTLSDVTKNFSPAWFSAIMGTGSISVLFHNFPYGTETTAVRVLSLIFFFLNLALAITCTVISIARYTLYTGLWSTMMRHPVQNLYLGCYPMGITTLINVAVGLIYQDLKWGGTGFLYFLWGVWWADVAASFVCCWMGVHYMISRQEHALEECTTLWLLPVVTLIVGSSSGGVLAGALIEVSFEHAYITTVFTVFMVTIGLSLALMLTNIYFYRLLLHGAPKGPLVASAWLNLGPAGQAGFSILEIGTSFKALLPLKYGTSPILTAEATGSTIDVMCTCISFFLWAFGTMWLFYSALQTWDARKDKRLSFQVGFWGTIFPNGVYANLTVQLYRTLDSPFFRVFGALWSIVTMLVWLGVFSMTMRYMYHLQILLMDTGLGLVSFDDYEARRRKSAISPESRTTDASSTGYENTVTSRPLEKNGDASNRV